MASSSSSSSTMRSYSLTGRRSRACRSRPPRNVRSLSHLLPEFVERLVRAAALLNLYLPFGLKFVQGVPDLALLLTQQAVPVGRGVEDAVRDGAQDLKYLPLRLLHGPRPASRGPAWPRRRVGWSGPHRAPLRPRLRGPRPALAGYPAAPGSAPLWG